MKLSESRGKSQINMQNAFTWDDIGLHFLLPNVKPMQSYLLNSLWMLYLQHSLRCDLGGRDENSTETLFWQLIKEWVTSE